MTFWVHGMIKDGSFFTLEEKAWDLSWVLLMGIGGRGSYAANEQKGSLFKDQPASNYGESFDFDNNYKYKRW